MFELDITRDFSAAHRLVGYNGLCSALHGHNWTVQVFIRAAKLDEILDMPKEKLDAIRAAAIESVRANYSVAKMCASTLALYRELETSTR